MNWLWLIGGATLGVIWIWRVLDAFLGMRKMPDLAAPAFDAMPANAAGEVPPVSIIVPARNEAEHVEATLQSLLALDYPGCRVIAVDDRSNDATGQILDRLGDENRDGMRVIHVEELPAGWLGKTHAMWVAVQSIADLASGEPGRSSKAIDDGWLLFTDADVIFRPDALRRAVVYAEQSGADHLVLLPKVEVETAGGRMMLAFFGILFLFWHRPWKAADPRASDSIGIGAFNLVRIRVYQAVGGWQALRLAVVEDMKLGETIKRHGFAQKVAAGQSLLRNFWARDASGIMNNLTKNFFALARYSLGRSLGVCLLLLLFHVVPFAAIFLAPGLAKLGFAATLVAIAAVYVARSQSGTSPFYFLLHPLAAMLYIYVMLRSMALTLWRGGVVWRGTKYPLGELRRQG